MTRGSLTVIAAFLLCVGVNYPLHAQGRKAKREARNTESEKPKNVAGGVTFQVVKPFEATYEATLNYLKREGHTIDSADKDIGQIITAIDIKGGYSQTGTRVQLTLIKDKEAQTTVRVAVTKQKRKKALQTEPWSDPKVDAEESTALAEAVKAAVSTP